MLPHPFLHPPPSADQQPILPRSAALAPLRHSNIRKNSSAIAPEIFRARDSVHDRNTRKESVSSCPREFRLGLLHPASHRAHLPLPPSSAANTPGPSRPYHTSAKQELYGKFHDSLQEFTVIHAIYPSSTSVIQPERSSFRNSLRERNATSVDSPLSSNIGSATFSHSVMAHSFCRLRTRSAIPSRQISKCLDSRFPSNFRD